VKARLLFLFVLTPLGVLGRPYWKRRLGLAFHPDAKTYWRRREGGDELKTL
jgi:hypothetical protein